MFRSTHAAQLVLQTPAICHDFGYLAGQPLTHHPDIVELLTVSTQQSPLSRVQRAAELAHQRSTQLPGDEP
ncbi:hypothetical protein ACVWYU_005958 [Pseudomonas sp. TE12234]